MSIQSSRAPKIGAFAGCLVAILVLLYGYLGSQLPYRAINDWVILLVCPLSITLMALDNGTWYEFVIADAMVILGNALVYAGVFALTAHLFRPRTKRPLPTERAAD